VSSSACDHLVARVPSGGQTSVRAFADEVVSLELGPRAET
jgi:hypothetical protein